MFLFQIDAQCKIIKYFHKTYPNTLTHTLTACAQILQCNVQQSITSAQAERSFSKLNLQRCHENVQRVERKIPVEFVHKIWNGRKSCVNLCRTEVRCV